MSAQSMSRRIDRLGADVSSSSILDDLEAAGLRARNWHRAGNTGPLPFAPLPELMFNATRAQRDLRARMEAGRRCVIEARTQ